MNRKTRIYLIYCKVAVHVAFIPLLYLIPTDGIFNGRSICLFKNVFGIECWGCGMTRAVFSLLYLNFEDAFHYNRLIVIVAPLLLYLYAKQTLYLYREVRGVK